MAYQFVQLIAISGLMTARMIILVLTTGEEISTGEMEQITALLNQNVTLFRKFLLMPPTSVRGYSDS